MLSKGLACVIYVCEEGSLVFFKTNLLHLYNAVLFFHCIGFPHIVYDKPQRNMNIAHFM